MSKEHVATGTGGYINFTENHLPMKAWMLRHDRKSPPSGHLQQMWSIRNIDTIHSSAKSTTALQPHCAVDACSKPPNACSMHATPQRCRIIRQVRQALRTEAAMRAESSNISRIRPLDIVSRTVTKKLFSPVEQNLISDNCYLFQATRAAQTREANSGQLPARQQKLPCTTRGRHLEKAWQSHMETDASPQHEWSETCLSKR